MNQPARQLSRYGWRPADPARRPVLFINPGQDLAALAGEAAAVGADALGMAGGDGSLAVVAAVGATRGIPFVCVPAGTHNHFALEADVDGTT